MIIITKSSRERENANERRINLMNLFLREKERNLIEIKKVAKLIDKKISKLTGRPFNHTYQNTMAMWATKSDPQAALGEDDPLIEISDAIFAEALIPGEHNIYKSDLQKMKGKTFIESLRIHSHTTDERLFGPLDEVIGGISIADSDMIYPIGETENEPEEAKKKKRKLFPKSKDKKA